MLHRPVLCCTVWHPTLTLTHKPRSPPSPAAQGADPQQPARAAPGGCSLGVRARVSVQWGRSLGVFVHVEPVGAVSRCAVPILAWPLLCAVPIPACPLLPAAFPLCTCPHLVHTQLTLPQPTQCPHMHSARTTTNPPRHPAPPGCRPPSAGWTGCCGAWRRRRTRWRQCRQSSRRGRPTLRRRGAPAPQAG